MEIRRKKYIVIKHLEYFKYDVYDRRSENQIY